MQELTLEIKKLFFQRTQALFKVRQSVVRIPLEEHAAWKSSISAAKAMSIAVN